MALVTWNNILWKRSKAHCLKSGVLINCICTVVGVGQTGDGLCGRNIPRKWHDRLQGLSHTGAAPEIHRSLCEVPKGYEHGGYWRPR